MASLGWLLNLGFGGSPTGVGVVGPVAGSLLMLGVGRLWWVPFIWQLTTGQAYAGEIDHMEQYISPVAFTLAGALAVFGFFKFKEYKEAKRLAALPQPFVDDKKRSSVVGKLGGPGRKCPICGKEKELVIYSDGLFACVECKEQ